MFLTLNSKPPFSLAPPPPLFFSFSFISLYKALLLNVGSIVCYIGYLHNLVFQVYSISKARKNNNCPFFSLFFKGIQSKKLKADTHGKCFCFIKNSWSIISLRGWHLISIEMEAPYPFAKAPSVVATLVGEICLCS